MKGKIFDRQGRILAVVEVKGSPELYIGQIEKLTPDPAIKALFNDYRESVNGQLFVEVDRLDREIEELEPEMVADSGEKFRIWDLQIYPEEMSVSFRPLIHSE